MPGYVFCRPSVHTIRAGSFGQCLGFFYWLKLVLKILYSELFRHLCHVFLSLRSTSWSTTPFDFRAWTKAVLESRGRTCELSTTHETRNKFVTISCLPCSLWRWPRHQGSAHLFLHCREAYEATPCQVSAANYQKHLSFMLWEIHVSFAAKGGEHRQQVKVIPAGP